jgi:hypothetical protein
MSETLVVFLAELRLVLPEESCLIGGDGETASCCWAS